MAKNKHNKKKNTILVFECAVREIARLSMAKKTTEAEKIGQIIKEFFYKGSILSNELLIYKEILSTENQEKSVCEKILKEALERYNNLSKDDLENTRMRFVKKCSSVSSTFLENFVQDFRNYGTLFQYFNKPLDGKIKDHVLLENSIIEKMVSAEKKEENKLIPKDDLVMKSFINRFNETYGSLRPEQKELIKKYTFSIGNKSLEYKMFLNDEIGRLKGRLIENKGNFTEEINKQIEQLIAICEGYSKQPDLNENEVIRLLEVQDLVGLLNEK